MFLLTSKECLLFTASSCLKEGDVLRIDFWLSCAALSRFQLVNLNKCLISHTELLRLGAAEAEEDE